MLDDTGAAFQLTGNAFEIGDRAKVTIHDPVAVVGDEGAAVGGQAQDDAAAKRFEKAHLRRVTVAHHFDWHGPGHAELRREFALVDDDDKAAAGLLSTIFSL